MKELEKVIILIRQLRSESFRYLAYLKQNPPKSEFDKMVRKEYDSRVLAYSELLTMLESGQPIENFIDD